MIEPGSSKEKILACVEAAGARGKTQHELAADLKYNSVMVNARLRWLHSEGRLYKTENWRRHNDGKSRVYIGVKAAREMYAADVANG